MKKLIFPILAITLNSCSKGTEKFENYLKKEMKVSDLEIKDYEFKSFDLSQKEYFIKMSDDAHDEFKNDESYSYEMAMNDLALSSKYIDSASKADANKKYTITKYFKLRDKDTINFGYFYQNENGKIINFKPIK